ncbi:hypothetical protein WQQ_11910 [Hydrocarboniphaga effusa AP103]|uniref:Uncharacterized protein n=1 Tax=Hydrocarboniphaga effusa AP103 TaxID=1172194 RepID=I7ZGP2_9GAMM|nr:hypothetical protein WQQ_11910 [Hydrocarboniphaga effusa AP103]
MKWLPQPLLDYRHPQYWAKPNTVIEHRVAPACEHHGAPVDAALALASGHGPMLLAGFGGCVFGGLRQLAVAHDFTALVDSESRLAPLKH